MAKQDEKQRLRRRLQDQSIELASTNHWNEAVETNRQILALGDKARPPLARQREANGMSLVMQTSALVTRSAIQSSAMSAPASTVIMVTFGRPVGRIGREPLATTKTGKPSRSATR